MAKSERRLEKEARKMEMQAEKRLQDQYRKKNLPLIVRILIVLFTTIGMILLLAVGACFVLLKGPSEKAKELFTLSCNETSAMKWVPGVFLSDDEVQLILNPELKAAREQEGMYYIKIEGDDMDISFVTNEELGSEALLTSINIDSEGNATGDTPVGTAGDEGLNDAAAEDVPVYELVDLIGGTYKGKLLLVHDPSKVQVASITSFGGAGWTLSQFLENYNAIACTNAGGFEDENGKGKGGIPDGLVIRDGQIVYGEAGASYVDVVGFDADNVLHVGNMSGQQALNEGIVNGTSFALGPVLIKDGERQSGFNSGINPRSAIGQTADGTVIMIAIEGRMVDSLGATFEDLADIFEQYGAINAANLDGGSSSGMYYEGERITRSSSVIGDRPLPTAIVVER